jgi:hypothetical protein
MLADANSIPHLGIIVIAHICVVGCVDDFTLGSLDVMVETIWYC